MTTFITRQTLASYPGVTIDNVGTAELVVDLVNGLITDIIGEPDPIPTRAVTVAYEAAARALRNPQGVESVTTGVDDWKKTVRYANAESLRAGVYLTKEDVAALLGKKGVKRVKSIGLGVPDRGFGF